jgi:hypothetical protein
LWLEYLSYEIDEDPNAEFIGLEDTIVQFKTGDPMIDAIEEKLAKGEEVDLIQMMMTEEDQTRFRDRLKPKE